MVTIIITISNNLNSLEVAVMDVFDDSNKSAISRSEVVSLDGANLAFIYTQLVLYIYMLSNKYIINNKIKSFMKSLYLDAKEIV